MTTATSHRHTRFRPPRGAPAPMAIAMVIVLGSIMTVIDVTIVNVAIPVLIGPLAGPILGGRLVDSASWRWIFFINVPIGALVLLLAGRILPADTPEPGHHLDVPGLLMLSPGLAVAIYGLATGGEHGDFGTAKALIPTLPGTAERGIGAVRGLPAPARPAIAPPLADAFQHTYVWAVALMALALPPALFLPGHLSKGRQS